MDNHRCILYVEDDANDAFFLQSALGGEHLAQHLQSVSDGEQALSYLEGRGTYGNRSMFPLPGLMILDLKIPKKPGLEVLKWLRSDTRFKNLPVVILTASEETTDVERAKKLGILAYFPKPVGLREVRELAARISSLWKTLLTSPEAADNRPTTAENSAAS